MGGKEAAELLNTETDYTKLFQACLKDPEVKFRQNKPKPKHHSKESIWTMDLLDLGKGK